MARSRTCSGLLLLLACGRNPAFDEPSPDPTAAATTTAPSTTTAPHDPTTGSTGAASTGTTTGGLVDPTTDTTATTDTTTGAAETTTTDASTGFVEPALPEKLQFYDTRNCGTPLWCHAADKPPNDGLPQRTAAQLCFRPATDPPYLLDRIGWVVAKTFGDLNDGTALEVYTGSADGPDQKLWEHALDAGGVTVQPHAFVFGDDPLLIPTPIFCVGLVGGRSDGDGAGLGIGVDPTQLAGDRSFIGFSGGGACDLPGWADVDELGLEPNGTWCIDADIRGN